MTPAGASAAFILGCVVTVALLRGEAPLVVGGGLWIALAVAFCASAAASLRDRRAALAAAVVVGIAAGVWTARSARLPEEGLRRFAGRTLSAEGTVIEPPGPEGTRLRMVVRVASADPGDGAVRMTGNLLVRTRLGWNLRYGDVVSLRGKIDAVEDPEDASYARYLASQGIAATMQADRVARTGSGAGSRMMAGIVAMRRSVEDAIARLYPEPQASFLAGLLIGARGDMPTAVKEDFKRTGLTHIVAISGYNITLLITMVSGMLFWLPLRWRIGPAAAGIAAFTLLVGASASAVRAAVMGVLGLLALHVGRKSDVRLALLWTLLAMTLWNPRQLWDDAGFQLSFLAVAGMVETGPLVEPITRRLPEAAGLRESVAAMLAAQLTAVPWILFLFGRLSVAAPVANLLVAPMLPVAMFSGALGTALSMLWLPLGSLAGLPAWIALSWVLEVARLLSLLPFASVDLPLAGPLLAAYYLLLASVIVRARRYQS